MSFFSYLKRVPRSYLVGGGVALVVLVIGANAFLRAAPTQTSVNQITHVTLATVGDLSSAAGPLELTGTVTSESQASILAQTSGEITALTHALGDYVQAGDVIATFENSAQRAAVTQAQGQYDAAQAALAKAQGATAANSSVTSSSAATGAQNAATTARAALASAYSALDDAVHTRADALFLNPRTGSPTVAFTVPDSALVSKLQYERAQLESELADAAALSSASSSTDIDSAALAMVAHANDIAAFMNDLIRAVNETPPSQATSAATLSGYQTSLAAARTETLGAVTSVTAAKGAYDSAVSGAATAATSAGAGTTNDIKAAQASALSAEGALAAANSALQKTIVRSPISGTIVSLPVTQGDYVSAFSPVATVSNPGALYVESQVTPDDAATIAVGNSAVVDGTIAGVVTFIAPALDPATGKIEVKIGLKGAVSGLTDGEVTTVALGRAAKPLAAGPLTIPIIAALISPTGPVVFTVTASSTLEAHPIVFGSILGDQVQVTSGLTSDMLIVADARGLAAGQTVAASTTTATSSAQ